MSGTARCPCRVGGGRFGGGGMPVVGTEATCTVAAAKSCATCTSTEGAETTEASPKYPCSWGACAAGGGMACTTAGWIHPSGGALCTAATGACGQGHPGGGGFGPVR